MTDLVTDGRTRKPVNVVDLGLQARVSRLVVDAMLPITRATFPNRDAAAKASARVMQPITNRHGMEVGALLFSLAGDSNGPTRVGTPVAGRENCRLSYQCGVLVRDAGRVPGGLLCGYVHSHPYELGFSESDLFTAREMQGKGGSTDEVTAYVSMPSGRVLAWSTRAMRDDPQRTWPEYAKRTVREVR